MQRWVELADTALQPKPGKSKNRKANDH
jgi:hypothetical protein